MLEAAQLYKDEIQRLYKKHWYDLDYQWYGAGTGHYEIDIPDNNIKRHMFASVARTEVLGVVNTRVIGVISYRVDAGVRGASYFGAMSFDKGNVIFAKDLFQCISDIFDKYKMNRIEWACVDGNPALRAYRRFCTQCGGTEHRLRQNTLTMDGQIRDSFIFEVIRPEWEHYKSIHKMKDRKESNINV